MSDPDASTPRASRDASKPEAVPIAPYPPRDVEPMEREYELRRLWEAPDRGAFFAEVAAGVRAVATRGELGAEGFETRIAHGDIAPAAGVPYACYADAVALAASDIPVVAVAGGEATRNIVDARVLEALGPRGVLVNIARGSTVDDDAPIAALDSGALAGAALDVVCNEPNVDPRLLSLADVVVRRRRSSGAIETRKAMGKLVRDNLAAHFAGRPLPTPVV